MSDSPSVRPHGATWLPLKGISWYLRVFEDFEKSVVKILAAIRSTLHGDRCTFMVITCSVLLRVRKGLDRSCEDN
jgi:hypothetical protein